MTEQTGTAIPKKRGRPPRIREAEVRTEPVREAMRETARVRTRKGSGTDQLHIPREMIPEDVDLQWVPDSILGQPAIQQRMSFEVNGWRPVTGDMWDGRFDGMFMPKGHKGEINVGGLVLMERPLELTLEARAEENKSARDAVRAEEAKLRGGNIDGVAFDTNHPTARAKTFINKERLPSMPIPQ